MTKSELKETINGLPQNLRLNATAGVRVVDNRINITNDNMMEYAIETTSVTLKELLFQYIDELDTDHSNICKKINIKILEKRIKLWAKSKNLDSEFEYLILNACLDLFSRDINWRE